MNVSMTPTLGKVLAAVNYDGIAWGTSTVGHVHAGVFSASPTFGYTSNRAGFKPDDFKSIDYAILTEVDPVQTTPSLRRLAQLRPGPAVGDGRDEQTPPRRDILQSPRHRLTRAEKLCYDETCLGSRGRNSKSCQCSAPA
jgi:hypothetical protein